MTYKKKKYYDPMTARKADAMPLGEAIEQLLDTFKIRDRYMEQDVMASWEQLMGKTIASRTENLYIKHKVLYVKLNSAVLRQELAMSKSKIIEMLNKHAGGNFVTEIVFQ